MNSIYTQLNKIDDSKSLNEKWNVKNQRELRKLIKESIEGADEAIDFAREYILDQHSYNDYDFEETDTEFSMTLWCGGSYFDDDDSEVKYKMSIQKLVELKDDKEAFEEYIDSCQDYTDFEAVGQEFYRRAEEELNKHFNCTGAFLEPSTQLGQGSTFLFADDMGFEGSFDFQTGEDYIRADDFDGFLQLCKNSFTVVTNESLDKPVTVEYIKDLVNKLKDELPYGFLTIGDNAVRYMTEEMDGVYYATFEDIAKALDADPELADYVENEDVFELIDCLPEKIFMHHAFEIETFVENVKRLNMKYFGSEEVDEVDKEFANASDDTLALFDESVSKTQIEGLQ